ncbi:hypothetical protein D3C85_388620 [compost metagenome]
MKRLSTYLGLAIAACLFCFSVPSMAEPLRTFGYQLAALAEPQGVAMQRLELTLAMWRTGSESGTEELKSNLRASSNHFVMTSASADPEGVGIGEGLTTC